MAKNIEMRFKFENLIVWQKAMELGEDIHKMTYDLPKEERYNFAQQVRRAADSIALNLAEGSIGQTNPEFKKFLGYSIRSLAEVVTCLHKTRKREYISEEVFNQVYEESFNLMNMLVGLKKSVDRPRAVA